MRATLHFTPLLAPLLVALAGCTLVRSPIVPQRDTGGLDAGVDAPIPDVPGLDAPDSPMDAPIPDVPGLDAPDSPVIDTGVDAPLPDVPVIDTGVDAPMPIDTGVDAPLPVDTGVDAPPPPVDCDALFGGLTNYELCSEESTTCTFYVDRPGTESCTTMCALVPGSTCMAARWSAGACPGGGDVTCGSTGNDRVCTCTRP